MRAYQIVGAIILGVLLVTGSIWLKYKKCEWLAPDHIGYCMFLTK